MPKMNLPQTMRLNRLIALTTELSRRAADEAIEKGRVILNGAVITKLATQVDPSKDHVKLDGRNLTLPKRFTYVAFYKPPLCLVTKSDPKGRNTIWDHLSKFKNSLNSVGRLDFETEGLLLLSDDGDFIQHLTHPKHEFWKTYQIKVSGKPSRHTLDELRQGVELEDGKTLPAKVSSVREGEEHSWIEVSIREGKNRQLRCMCDAVGHPVIRLRRIAVGSLKIGRLKKGAWRFLNAKEIASLKNML